MRNMDRYQSFDAALLNDAGLNRHAVFDIDALPSDVLASIQASCRAHNTYRQLIVIGHAGKALWNAVKAAHIDSEHPIDDFSTQTVRQWLAACHAQNTYELLYPSEHAINLQQLGQLAGWHHASPFMIGIDPEWGTWYAYRAVVVADTHFEPTPSLDIAHPCQSCQHKICISNCPAGAMDEGKFDLAKCATYRKQEGSKCKSTCLARISCPVGSAHRYSDEQLHHTYSISMRAIEKYY